MVDGCWTWRGAKNSKNYGQFFTRDTKTTGAHRVSYTLFKGDLTKGLTIDHLCRNTLCVNPEHLEEVTQAENNRRIGPRAPGGISKLNLTKTHCLKGHEFNPENVYIRKDRNGRECKPCRNEASKRAIEKRRSITP